MDLGANIIMVVSKYIIDINFNQYRKSILPLKSKTKRLQVGQTLIFFIRAGYDFFSLYVTWIEDTSFIFSLLALIIARARESDRKPPFSNVRERRTSALPNYSDAEVLLAIIIILLFRLQMSHTNDRTRSVSFDGIYPIIIITYIIIDETYIVHNRYIYYIKHVVRVRRAYCYLWESTIIVRLLLLLLFCRVTFSRCAHLSLGGVWFV